ncbi:uncharacterized protein EI90DRAFT_3152800 [Cantharellus anzutake]|uniref:uncharacterized protein n=1 Tax=Cantharellus anzutake TaxID=1750568 RepID=UPI001908CA6E|nr:uncharacterized protein EI90DRAFT_3152800 [Cantharellus anzutake]KAF8335775.1 hypothetical protein EI90DRAFT_3152800 [Cantharellus anzutake]
MPSTTIIGTAPGWTLFENLYMSNGALLIISDDPRSSFPDPLLLTSTGAPAENTPENIKAREPTKDHFDIISRDVARSRYGKRISTISDTTFLFNDPRQFLDHYYHFAAELLLGAWRMYSGWLDPTIDKRGKTKLPDPARAIFAHAYADEWRDYIGYNQYFLHAAFPSIGLETEIDWKGRIIMTNGTYGTLEDNGASGTARAWRFDRVLLVDRSAAFRSELTGAITQRTAASAYFSNHDKASQFWWETIRRRVLSFARVPNEILDYSIPAGLRDRGNREEPPILITYVSRQGWRRRLIEEDHIKLVESLEELCKSKRWEFLIFHPERYNRDQQLEIAARTTVMLGVHGNGLTHVIAMPRRPISTVIEIFYPKGFAKDYQWTAEALGHKHFSIWNNSYFSSPNLPWVNYPEGFQGTQIPVHGPTVARLIEDRVEGRLPNPPLPLSTARPNS